jgi:hypothetical protein
MSKYKFLFHVDHKHLIESARKYAPKDLYMQIEYRGKGESVIVDEIRSNAMLHKSIKWSLGIYQEISQAARNNYQSQMEPA